MNVQEKTFARQLFQNKILKADGQIFEDIFSAVMNYAETDFQQIKSWGNIGDRKNDGYIKTKGIFYQVYAPEDIRKSYTNVVSTCLAKMCHLHLHGVKQLSLDYPSPDRYSQIRWHLTPHRLNG
ncbi:MAG: hypothetical protein WBE22_03490 [Halobacteriota archaeon]